MVRPRRPPRGRSRHGDGDRQRPWRRCGAGRRAPVDYRVADLLDPPPEWSEGFDLVVESMTVQALPRSLRERATAGVQGFVAGGGTLVVIAFARTDEDADDAGPPWPLTRDEVEAFASERLRPG